MLNPHTALLVVDMQARYLIEVATDELMPLYKAFGRVLCAAVDRRAPIIVVEASQAEEPTVIYVRNIVGASHCRFTIRKTWTSAFKDTPLDRILRGLDVSQIVVTGLWAHACVTDTAWDGVQLGYRTTVAYDLIADHANFHKRDRNRSWLSQHTTYLDTLPL